tara:strand:+ start:1937 stop:2620 length:684 start_codon:yes stop_codon:yes gene_type:complete
MGPWDTVEEMQEDESEEDIDMFAVLGAVQPTTTPVTSNLSAPISTTSNDPLAAFMDDDDEDTLTADSLFSMNDEPNASIAITQEPTVQISNVNESTPVASSQEQSPVLSNEVITDLLEILVKNELQARVERGEDWLSDLPAQAVADIQSAKIVKQQEAYHLSLIIDMVGTGQVRPFATVLSTGDGVLPVSPPSHLSQSWLPLYNALRELLVQAMSALSKVNVVSTKA